MPVVGRETDRAVVVEQVLFVQRRQTLLDPQRVLLAQDVHVAVMQCVREFVPQRARMAEGDQLAAAVVVQAGDVRTCQQASGIRA